MIGMNAKDCDFYSTKDNKLDSGFVFVSLKLNTFGEKK